MQIRDWSVININNLRQPIHTIAMNNSSDNKACVGHYPSLLLIFIIFFHQKTQCFYFSVNINCCILGLNPLICPTNCMCHRSALASNDAIEDSTYIAYHFKASLGEVYIYCEYSGQHRGHLDKIQTFLYGETRHLVQNTVTRWLSYMKVCLTLHKVLSSVICIVTVIVRHNALTKIQTFVIGTQCA